MDTIIKNAKVVDGTGRPSFRGDIGIAGDKIVGVGGRIEAEGARVIDATDLVASPGFVDPHNHLDTSCVIWPVQTNFVTQGVTTAASGQCGYSAAPDSETYSDSVKTKCILAMAFAADKLPLEESWASQSEYAAIVNAKGVAIDVVPNVGHSMLRWRVGLRGENDIATDAHIEEMKRLLRLNLEEGAMGFTTGMDYDPNKYASYEECLALSRVCAEFGRPVQAHIPYAGCAPGGRWAVSLAKESQAKWIIAHYGSCMPSVWKDHEEMLAIVDEALRDGVDISFNVMMDTHYVFKASGWKGLIQWIAYIYAGKTWQPEEFEENCRNRSFRRGLRELLEHYGKLPNDIIPEYVSLLPRAALVQSGNPEIEGRPLEEVARERNLDRVDLVYDVICGQSDLVEQGKDPILDVVVLDEEFNVDATNHEVGMPCTDLVVNETSGPEMIATTPWPGGYNTMPLYFRRTRERGIRTEEAVRHMTSIPAASLDLYDRGVLAKGMKADVVLFDEERFAPMATYDNVIAPAAGVEWVLLSGVPTLEKGVQTKNLPGRMLSAV